jgi:hypothetical protein
LFVAQPTSRVLWTAFRSTVTIVISLTGFLTLRTWRKNHQEGRELISLWLWIVSMSCLQVFFNPGALRFRLLWLPVFLYIGFKTSAHWRGWLKGIAAWIVVGGIAAINFQHTIRPQMTVSSQKLRVEWLNKIVGPGDFLLFSGFGSGSIVNVYMAYFGYQVPARSLYGYLLFPDIHRPMDEMTRRVLAVHQSGGKIFMENELLNPAWQHYIETARHVPSGTLSGWMRSYQPGLIVQGPNGYDLVQMCPCVY